jgi:amino acid transporter
MAGAVYVWPITTGIVVLLGIVYFSYPQAIPAYPQGGGSYTVATENLGEGPGLLAAAALIIVYVLTAAVGISAGVGALVSAVQALQSQILSLCLAILIVNPHHQSTRSAGDRRIFLLPAYAFVVCVLGLSAVGVFKSFAAGGHPLPVGVHAFTSAPERLQIARAKGRRIQGANMRRVRLRAACLQHARPVDHFECFLVAIKVAASSF